MTLRYSRRALTQIRDILAYISTDNPRAAENVAVRIENLVLLTSRHPGIGRPTNLKNIRVLSARPYPYLIFYKVEPGDVGGITALRVRHTARKEDWRDGR